MFGFNLMPIVAVVLTVVVAVMLLKALLWYVLPNRNK